jgi:NTP pyrophosphatase (non-canonical NTP hydrolase)
MKQGRNLFVAATAAEAKAAGSAAAMTFAGFSAENLARCTAPNGFNHPLDGWSLSDWMTALCGEIGEAANVLKKLNRERDGIPGNSQSIEELRAAFADELADSFIYLDLLAQAAGIDLAATIRSKFDRTSAKIGYAP